MTWKYNSEQTGLMPISKFSAENYTVMAKQPDKSWKAITDVEGIKSGWQVDGCKQAHWSPVTCVWVPRKFYRISCVPKDPYYNMGKMEFWLDKKSLWSQYKLMDDIAGEYWKTGIFMVQFMKWGDNDNISQTSNMHLFVDVKTKHSTILRSSGKNIFGRDLMYEFKVPNMKEKFSVNRLNTWTK